MFGHFILTDFADPMETYLRPLYAIFTNALDFDVRDCVQLPAVRKGDLI